MKYTIGTNYDDIKSPPGIDCASVHDGFFESKGLEIERKGSWQKESDKKSGRTMEFNVVWVNDCEYYLMEGRDTSQRIKVRITNVKPDSYDCYVQPEGFGQKYPSFMTIRRIAGK